MKLIWRTKLYDELSLDELYSILKIRQEVFVVEQNCPYLDCDGLDKKAIHILGFFDNKLISYMRILRTVEVSSPHLGRLYFGRILVSKNKRKLGLGEKVMLEALSYSEDNYPGELVEMSAQAYLVNFYKKFKFKVLGKEYLEDGIPHVKMIKN